MMRNIEIPHRLNMMRNLDVPQRLKMMRNTEIPHRLNMMRNVKIDTIHKIHIDLKMTRHVKTHAI